MIVIFNNNINNNNHVPFDNLFPNGNNFPNLLILKILM